LLLCWPLLCPLAAKKKKLRLKLPLLQLKLPLLKLLKHPLLQLTLPAIAGFFHVHQPHGSSEGRKKTGASAGFFTSFAAAMWLMDMKKARNCGLFACRVLTAVR